MPLPMEIWRMLAGADTCEADFPRCDFNTAKSLPPTRCFAPSCSAAALPIALARQQKTRSPARARSNARQLTPTRAMTFRTTPSANKSLSNQAEKIRPAGRKISAPDQPLRICQQRLAPTPYRTTTIVDPIDAHRPRSANPNLVYGC